MRMPQRILMFGLLLASAWTTSAQCRGAKTARLAATSPLGTWTGQSLCVGDRPGCKDEVLVYRFEAVPGAKGEVLQLADKIIDGARVPMGKLTFAYRRSTGELSSDFTVGRMHGLWRYTVTGDSLVGTLVLLPERKLVRRVTATRVADSQVPAAPARREYD